MDTMLRLTYDHLETIYTWSGEKFSTTWKVYIVILNSVLLGKFLVQTRGQRRPFVDKRLFECYKSQIFQVLTLGSYPLSCALIEVKKHYIEGMSTMRVENKAWVPRLVDIKEGGLEEIAVGVLFSGWEEGHHPTSPPDISQFVMPACFQLGFKTIIWVGGGWVSKKISPPKIGGVSPFGQSTRFFIVAELFCTIVCILCNRDHLMVQKCVIYGAIKLVEGSIVRNWRIIHCAVKVTWLVGVTAQSWPNHLSLWGKPPSPTLAEICYILCVTIAHCFSLSQLHNATVSLFVIAHCTLHKIQLHINLSLCGTFHNWTSNCKINSLQILYARRMQ